MTVRRVLGRVADAAIDGVAWSVAPGAVAPVRYQPAHTKLLMACGSRQAHGPQRVVDGVTMLLVRPGVARWLDLPHRGVRGLAQLAARWFGPTASAVVRFTSGAV